MGLPTLPALLPPATLALLLGVGAAWADPEAFDPLLDVPPQDRDPAERLSPPDPRNPGFRVSGHVGLYGGRVRSFLTSELSELQATAPRGEVGFGFGYRTRSLIEIGLDLGLGLGQTWDNDNDLTVYAFDLLIEPRVLAHALEGEDWGLYGGVGGLAILFDLEPAGLNQAGMGPNLIAGVKRRLDAHSVLYLEGGYCYFYDALAYTYEDPSEAELAKNPTAQPERVDGDWYSIFRATLGYRLTL
ncbi:MAG: hypothetical protein H6704_30420 [Myxococcales bacterium]|nr:hypothetical protein [Myxococcales bacterium]MCB9540555.1 hypothetical protein [Myxococcales bacterium]